MRLDGRVAIVTGSGRGIGRGIALEMAEAGAIVAIADVSRDEASEVSDEIKSLGYNGIPLCMDVTNSSSIIRNLERVVRDYGKIDILVNNAGVFQKSHIMSLDVGPEDFDRCYSVNLKGAWLVIKEVIPCFKQNRYGKIINISSIAGLAGGGALAYSASKAGIINLTQSLAKMLGPDNINVNAVCPGVVQTSMMKEISMMAADETQFDSIESAEVFFANIVERIPLKRPQTPQDIGNICVFLASEAAKNITGQTISVDGGHT